MRFHDHQGDTLRIHEKYLKYQQEYTQNYFQLLQEHFHLLTSEKAAINHVNHPQILSDSAPMGEEKIIPFIKNTEKTLTVVPEIPINIDKATLSQNLL